MKNEMVKFEDLDIDALTLACQSAFEDVEDVFRVVEKNRTRLEYFGKLLTAAKSKVPHGEWDNWITDTFQGRLKIRTAQLWMAKAQKVALLESGEVPRESRKPGRVQVLEPSAGAATEDTPAEYQDDDPAPDPPTQRKTAAGSRKVTEAEKPKPRPVVPEVIEADEPASPFEVELEDGAVILRESDTTGILTLCLRCVPVKTILHGLSVEKLKDDAKKNANLLRKLADKLDPPTKFVPPSVEEVEEYCRSRNNGIDAEAFVAHGRANGWKLSNGNKMQDWQGAIITWEKNQKRFEQNGKGNRNEHTKQSLADSIADKAAYLRDIFGDAGAR